MCQIPHRNHDVIFYNIRLKRNYSSVTGGESEESFCCIWSLLVACAYDNMPSPQEMCFLSFLSFFFQHLINLCVLGSPWPQVIWKSKHNCNGCHENEIFQIRLKYMHVPLSFNQSPLRNILSLYYNNRNSNQWLGCQIYPTKSDSGLFYAGWSSRLDWNYYSDHELRGITVRPTHNIIANKMLFINFSHS